MRESAAVQGLVGVGAGSSFSVLLELLFELLFELFLSEESDLFESVLSESDLFESDLFESFLPGIVLAVVRLAGIAVIAVAVAVAAVVGFVGFVGIVRSFSGPTAMTLSMAIFVVFSPVSVSLSFTPSTGDGVRLLDFAVFAFLPYRDFARLQVRVDDGLRAERHFLRAGLLTMRHAADAQNGRLAVLFFDTDAILPCPT